MPDTLSIMLKELRLPAFEQHHEAYQAQAIDQAWGYQKYLAKLCEYEIARQFEKRIQKWTHEPRKIS